MQYVQQEIVPGKRVTLLDMHKGLDFIEAGLGDLLVMRLNSVLQDLDALVTFLSGLDALLQVMIPIM